MYTRREAIASIGAVSALGLAGCLGDDGESLLSEYSGEDEEENPFEPAVTPEPLPGSAPLLPGLARTNQPPHITVEDHLAISNAHLDHLADYPACRYTETETATLYDSGAEVVGWTVEGDAMNIQTTRRETTVTDAAYLMEQTYDFTEWEGEPRNAQQALNQFVEYSEFLAVDAHVRRANADYDPLDIEEGTLNDKTPRYSSYADAERELQQELEKKRDAKFGLLGDIYEVERVEGGVKLKTYRDMRGTEDKEVLDDRHDFHYWLFDDSGYIRERRKMYVYLQPEGRLSVIVSTQQWNPIENAPDQLEPGWVGEAREWKYPNDWYEGQ